MLFQSVLVSPPLVAAGHAKHGLQKADTGTVFAALLPMRLLVHHQPQPRANTLTRHHGFAGVRSPAAGWAPIAMDRICRFGENRDLETNR